MAKKIKVSIVPYTLDDSLPTHPALLTDDGYVLFQDPPPTGIGVVDANGNVLPRPPQAGDKMAIDEDGGCRARTADVVDDAGSHFAVGTDANVLRCTVGGFTFPVLFRGND